jgi:hypothetical protein
MSGNKVSLGQLFKIQDREQNQDAANSEQMKEIKAKIAEESKGQFIPPMLYDKLFDLLIVKIGEVLENIDIGGDILGNAWGKIAELREYRDREQYPPDETFMVPLIDHEVNSEHLPLIELKLKQQLLAKFNIQIAVGLALEGVLLEIQDAKIKKIKIGSCKGIGTISYSEMNLLELPEQEPLELGNLDLGEGIEIAAAEGKEDAKKEDAEPSAENNAKAAD